VDPGAALGLRHYLEQGPELQQLMFEMLYEDKSSVTTRGVGSCDPLTLKKHIDLAMRIAEVVMEARFLITGKELQRVASAGVSTYVRSMFKFEFCLPTLGKSVHAGDVWFREIKYDGFRIRQRRSGAANHPGRLRLDKALSLDRQASWRTRN